MCCNASRARSTHASLHTRAPQKKSSNKKTHPADRRVEVAAPAAHALLVGAAVEAARDLRPLADAVRTHELDEPRVLVGRPLVALDARVDLFCEFGGVCARC